MLWSEENYVNKIDELQHHRELMQYLKNINKDNLPNMYFYGKKGSGKNTLIKLLLCHIFGKNAYKLSPVKYPLSDIYFFKNQFYYYIDITLLGKKPYNIFSEFIQQIINTKSVMNYHHVFIITNVEYINIQIIKYIKHCLDRKNSTSRFIFISNSLEKTKISNILNSFCFSIKIDFLNNKEIVSILKTISNKKNINIKSKTLNFIAELSKNNLTKALFYLQLRTNNVNEFKKYIKKHNKVYNVLYKLVTNKNIKNIVKIRENIYKIIIKNIDIYNFIREFVHYLIDKIGFNNINIIQNILHISSKTTKNLNHTSKEIITLEGFFIKLMTINWSELSESNL